MSMVGDAEGGVHQHRPDGADEDHEHGRGVGVLDDEQRQWHPGQRRYGFEHLDEGVECLVHQRRHADHEAKRHGNQTGHGKAQKHPVQRMPQLDTNALIVGATHIERIAQCRSGVGDHLRRCGHPGLLAATPGQAFILAHLLITKQPRCVDGHLPDAQKKDEKEPRQQGSTDSE